MSFGGAGGDWSRAECNRGYVPGVLWGRWVTRSVGYHGSRQRDVAAESFLLGWWRSVAGDRLQVYLEGVLSLGVTFQRVRGETQVPESCILAVGRYLVQQQSVGF